MESSASYFDTVPLPRFTDTSATLYQTNRHHELQNNIIKPENQMLEPKMGNSKSTKRRLQTPPSSPTIARCTPLTNLASHPPTLTIPRPKRCTKNWRDTSTKVKFLNGTILRRQVRPYLTAALCLVGGVSPSFSTFFLHRSYQINTS